MGKRYRVSFLVEADPSRPEGQREEIEQYIARGLLADVAYFISPTGVSIVHQKVEHFSTIDHPGRVTT